MNVLKDENSANNNLFQKHLSLHTLPLYLHLPLSRPGKSREKYSLN